MVILIFSELEFWLLILVELLEKEGLKAKKLITKIVKIASTLITKIKERGINKKKKIKKYIWV